MALAQYGMAPAWHRPSTAWHWPSMALTTAIMPVDASAWMMKTHAADAQRPVRVLRNRPLPSVLPGQPAMLAARPAKLLTSKHSRYRRVRTAVAEARGAPRPQAREPPCRREHERQDRRLRPLERHSGTALRGRALLVFAVVTACVCTRARACLRLCLSQRMRSVCPSADRSEDLRREY